MTHLCFPLPNSRGVFGRGRTNATESKPELVTVEKADRFIENHDAEEVL